MRREKHLTMTRRQATTKLVNHLANSGCSPHATVSEMQNALFMMLTSREISRLSSVTKSSVNEMNLRISRATHADKHFALPNRLLIIYTFSFGFSLSCADTHRVESSSGMKT